MGTNNDGSRLRALHPFYKIMAGDTLWELFIESGFTEDECGPLLDKSIEQMHEVLDLMRAVEKKEAQGFVYTAGQGKLCSACGSLVGKKVEGGDLFQMLPPFAVGCPLSCRVLKDEDKDLPEADPEKIMRSLVCQEFDRS